MVAAGPTYTYTVLTNGTLKCWRQNFYGQLGLGNVNDYGKNSNLVGTGCNRNSFTDSVENSRT